MSIILLETIQEINQFFGQPSSTIDLPLNSSRFNLNFNEGKRYVEEKILIKELESLKDNVENLYRHCQFLENENKVLKRIVSRTNESCSTYSYGKTSKFAENSTNKMESNKYISKVENSDYFTEFSRESQNSQKIEVLKNELAGLSNNLKMMTKKFEKYELDSTNENESKDFLTSESSFNSLEKKGGHESKSLSEEIDLEFLLCHEELSFDGNEFQKKSSATGETERNVVDSLIAKGIEFRESRALRSKEFQNLSNLIQQYRSEFENLPIKQSKKQQIALRYR